MDPDPEQKERLLFLLSKKRKAFGLDQRERELNGKRPYGGQRQLTQPGILPDDEKDREIRNLSDRIYPDLDLMDEFN